MSLKEIFATMKENKSEVIREAVGAIGITAGLCVVVVLMLIVG